MPPDWMRSEIRAESRDEGYALKGAASHPRLLLLLKSGVVQSISDAVNEALDTALRQAMHQDLVQYATDRSQWRVVVAAERELRQIGTDRGKNQLAGHRRKQRRGSSRFPHDGNYRLLVGNQNRKQQL